MIEIELNYFLSAEKLLWPSYFTVEWLEALYMYFKVYENCNRISLKEVPYRASSGDVYLFHVISYLPNKWILVFNELDKANIQALLRFIIYYTHSYVVFLLTCSSLPLLLSTVNSERILIDCILYKVPLENFSLMGTWDNTKTTDAKQKSEKNHLTSNYGPVSLTPAVRRGPVCSTIMDHFDRHNIFCHQQQNSKIHWDTAHPNKSSPDTQSG